MWLVLDVLAALVDVYLFAAVLYAIPVPSVRSTTRWR
jgi:hypothetical protein